MNAQVYASALIATNGPIVAHRIARSCVAGSSPDNHDRVLAECLWPPTHKNNRPIPYEKRKAVLQRNYNFWIQVQALVKKQAGF